MNSPAWADGDPVYSTIGKNLRRLRNESDFTAAYVAAGMTSLGSPWTVPTVSAVEAGHRIVDVVDFARLAAALGVAAEELVRPVPGVDPVPELDVLAGRAPTTTPDEGAVEAALRRQQLDSLAAKVARAVFDREPEPHDLDLVAALVPLLAGAHGVQAGDLLELRDAMASSASHVAKGHATRRITAAMSGDRTGPDWARWQAEEEAQRLEQEDSSAYWADLMDGERPGR